MPVIFSSVRNTFRLVDTANEIGPRPGQTRSLSTSFDQTDVRTEKTGDKLGTKLPVWAKSEYNVFESGVVWNSLENQGIVRKSNVTAM